MRFEKFILLSAGCMVAIAASAADSAGTIALSETPAAVQKAIQARVGDAQLGDIDQTTDGGETVYDVGLTAKDGQSRDFTVAEDGTLLSTQVALVETPAAVQKSIQTLAKAGEVDSIDKSLDDSGATYDVGLTAKDGSEKGFTLGEDGTLLSMTVSLAQVPEAVQATIRAELADGELKEVNKMFDPEGVTYDVEMAVKGGKEKAFAVAESGKLISRKVSLAETPPPVRRTIKEKLGDGKVLRIDQSLVVGKPFEVQGRKDGKSFDFSVGPRGKFLGMDEE